MTQIRPAAKAATLALELGLVSAAVLAGAHLANQVSIIPKALFRLPTVRFGADDVEVVLISTLAACAAAFLAARLFAGWAVFAGARRAATETYALVVGIVAAALYQFFLTAVNFSPEFMVQTTLIAVALFVLAHLVFGRAPNGALARPPAFIGDLFGLLRRPAAWAVIAFALTPLVVGRAFTQDRDFANWVTRIRVNSNVSADQPFTLVNALGTATFTTPIMLAFARSDPRTVYVLTRHGEVWRADYPGGGNARLLMNIGQKVGYVEMENGALGLDLHPEFGRAGSPNAGFAYIYYTAHRPDSQVNHLTRYDLSAASPQARADSALQLVAQKRNNDGYHNAGMVKFGPDRMLWFSVGESSMKACHQKIDCAMVGGIFRIDVDQRGGTISRPIARQPKDGTTANYYVPLDNPYAGRADALGEYWAHGLRNAFRFDFDPATGALWTGEVGSTTWEEVNRIEKGGNYQYPYTEGVTSQAPRYVRPERIEGTEQAPALTYRHTAFLRSVIGGAVYRGDALPALNGKYLFSDNYSGEIMAISANARRADKWEVVARSRDVAQRGLTAIVVAPDGAVLIPVMGDNDKPTGMIARLVPSESEAGRAVETKREEQRLAAASPAGQRAAALVQPVSIAQARTLYNVNCARCHGAEGRGNGPDAAELGHIPNFHEANFHKWRSDAEIIAVLNGGGGAVGGSELMPPWADILSPAEIAGVKDYVRSFNGKP